MTPHLSRRFAVSVTGTALACAGLVAAPAHATPLAPWSSAAPLGLANQSMFATVVSTDGGTVYSAAADPDDPAMVDVVSTSAATGETSGVQPMQLDVDPIDGSSPLISGIALAGDGTIVVTDAANHTFYTGAVTDGDLPSYATPFDDLTPTLSPDGHYAAIVGHIYADSTQISAVAVVDTTAPGAVTSSATLVDTSLPNTADGDAVTAAAVGDDGTVAAAGLLDGAATAWTMPLAGAPESTALAAAGTPRSLVVLADDSVAVDVVPPYDPDNDSPDTVAYSGGDLDGQAVTLFGYGATLVTDGTTVWAASGNDLERIDGTAVYSQDGTDFEAILGVAVSPASDALYVADAGYEAAEAQLQQFTAPAAPTALDAWASDDTISLHWSASDDLAAGAPSYLIRLTDTATSHVVEQMLQNYNNVDDPTSPNTMVEGVDTSHGYGIAVESFNGAFFSAPLTGSYLPSVPGDGKATVVGTPAVGSTLTAQVSGFQGDGITYTYAWGVVVVGGEWADETDIAGATSSTLALTPSLLGKKVTVTVTAHRAGNAPTPVSAPPVLVTAAPSSPGTGGGTPPAPAPQQHLAGVKAPKLKSGSKTVTLTLAGVTTLPGKVTVHDGKKLLGSATVTDGKLVLKLHKKLSHGKHHLKLEYAGSTQVAAFQQQVTLKVS